MEPISPYAATKLAGEQAVLAEDEAVKQEREALADALRKGDTTSAEITSACLTAIEGADALGAFVSAGAADPAARWGFSPLLPRSLSHRLAPFPPDIPPHHPPVA